MDRTTGSENKETFTLILFLLKVLKVQRGSMQYTACTKIPRNKNSEKAKMIGQFDRFTLIQAENSIERAGDINHCHIALL